MATLAIKGMDGRQSGTVDAADSVFGLAAEEIERRKLVVRETLNAFLQNQRQGTHATKTRGEVSGGGKKPWAQKHTGRARAGSIRPPHWRHGGVSHGPQPRDYREKVNAKKRQAAFRALLSARAAEGRVHVIDSISMAEPKTKNVIAMVKALGIDAAAATLIVTNGVNENLWKSTRNMTAVRTQLATSLSIYELLTADHVVVEKAALAKLEELFAPKATKEAA